MSNQKSGIPSSIYIHVCAVMYNEVEHLLEGHDDFNVEQFHDSVNVSVAIPIDDTDVLEAINNGAADDYFDLHPSVSKEELKKLLEDGPATYSYRVRHVSESCSINAHTALEAAEEWASRFLSLTTDKATLNISGPGHDGSKAITVRRQFTAEFKDDYR